MAITGRWPRAIFYDSKPHSSTLAFFVAMQTFVVLNEEPTLRRTFGRDYAEYCERVGRWWPR